MNQEKTGKFIRDLRNEKKLTQVELADKIGVTDRAVSKWENGRGSPDISLLIPLAKELDITVLELLSGEKESDSNKTVIEVIKKEKKKTSFWKRLFLGIINFLLIMMLIIIFYGFIIPKKYENNNYGIAIIYSDSMSPLLKTNDTVIYEKVSIDNVKVNDFVVFKYSSFFIGNNPDLMNTVHRVIDVIKEDNDIKLVTRGDNNSDIDENYVTKDNFIGVYRNKTSLITNFFLNYNFSSILCFLIIGIIAIIYLDILELYRIIVN